MTPSVPSDPMNRSMRVHLWLCEVASGALGHLRHAVGRERDSLLAHGVHHVYMPIGVSAHLTSTKVEYASVAQDDSKATHPLSRAAVLERGCPCRVGRHDPARHGTVEGGHWRIEHSPPREFVLHRTEGHAGLNGDRRVADFEYLVETIGGYDRVAERCRTAGERRLGSNRENASGVPDDVGHVPLGARSSHGHRVATWKMTGVLDIPADYVGVTSNRARAQGARSGCGSGPDRIGWHRTLIMRDYPGLSGMATPRRTRFANVAKVVQWRDGLFRIVELSMSVSREQLVLGVVSVVSCALPMLACAQPQEDDDTAARVGDTLITLGDVEDAWRQDDAASRMRMLQQLYDTRRQTLERVIGEHLIEREADARGMTREELLEAELPSRTEPIGDPEVELIYQENQNAFGGRTLEQMRPEILAFLEQQRPTQALHQFMDELRRAATDVVVLLDPPRQEVDVLPEDPSRGPEDAPIVLVEFSDFQCPFCQQATETIAQIVGAIRRPGQVHLQGLPPPKSCRSVQGGGGRKLRERPGYVLGTARQDVPDSGRPGCGRAEDLRDRIRARRRHVFDLSR